MGKAGRQLPYGGQPVLLTDEFLGRFFFGNVANDQNPAPFSRTNGYRLGVNFKI